MTALSDKLRTLAAMAEQGREADVYSGLEWLLRERQWPQWLRDGIDRMGLDEDRPINLQEAA